MKTLPKVIFPLCTLLLSPLGHAMEEGIASNDQITPLEQAHWSTQEIQTPLISKITKGLEEDSRIYIFLNETSTDLFLTLHYSLKSTNDSDIDFNTKLGLDEFMRTFEFQSGWLTEEIELKAKSSSSFSSLSTISFWSEIEKKIKEIAKSDVKADDKRFKFAVELNCSRKRFTDGIDLACPNSPILTLCTDELPLKYTYKNPFFSVFVIKEEETWPTFGDLDGRTYPYNISNHILCHSK